MKKQTIKEHLEEFYRVNAYGKDGGLSDFHVKIDLTPKFHFYYPNFDERRKAVLRHDIHHLATEYPTTILGESEISAWEIASGCKKYWFAFLIDTSGVMLGLLFNFWNILKAYSRGRRTKNTYHDFIPMEQILNMEISDLQRQLKLDIFTKDTKPNLTDWILFLLFVLYASIYFVLLFPLLPFVILYSIFVELKLRQTKRTRKQ